MTLIAKTYWGGMPFDFRAPPASARVEPVKLFSADARELRGLRYERAPKARIGVLLMHPRVDFTRHYAIPRLLDAGFAVLALNGRSPNDDSDTVHEELVLDVAAGVDALRAAGHARVVLVGNSGGGSLMALYQAQAEATPDARIARTPAGAPTLLPKARLSPADALVLIAAHRGQGHVLLRAIDPSVVDEADLDATDPALDMYAPENGFSEPPSPSRYAPDFVTRFREAQRARVARLDERARALLEPSRAARRAAKDAAFSSRPFAARQAVERALHARHVMVVYRTMANLAYADPAIGPSPRDYGSLLSARPDLMNRSLPGFARVVTPRAWLSTWSGLASNADLAKTLPGIAAPVLAVHAERDKEVFLEADFAVIRAAAASATSEIIRGAGHYFEPPFGERHAPHVDALMDVVVPWLETRLA